MATSMRVFRKSVQAGVWNEQLRRPFRGMKLALDTARDDPWRACRQISFVTR